MTTHSLLLNRKAKSTLTPVELDPGDTLSFTLHDGRVNTLRVASTSAEVLERNYADYGYDATFGDISAYAFTAVLEVNGKTHCLRREVGTQKSFYAPWKINGMHIWLDAVAVAHFVFRVIEQGGDYLLDPWILFSAMQQEV